MQNYELWFVNNSQNGGQACVYLDSSGVQGNNGEPDILAWMVQGANPNVAVRFLWTLSDCFLWVQDDPRAQQIQAADLTTENTITLSFNDFGFLFQSPTTETGDTLQILMDGSIPVGADAVAGIGLHNAGVYAYSVAPNQTLTFTPSSPPPYRLSFGNYNYTVNDVINPSSLNSPCDISFPANQYVMTATLGQDNAWTVTSGPPVSILAMERIYYEAGKGVVSSAEPPARI